MRVLIVQHGLFPGFVAPVAKECAKNLWRMGIDVQVAVVGERSPHGASEPLEFPIHCIKSDSALAAYAGVRELADGVDLVHYFLGKGLELLPLLARRPKYVFHHISASVTGSAAHDRLINFAKRMQVSFADHVIFTDQALASALCPIVPKPFSLLPVGYPDDLFHPCPPPAASSREKLLLYHGAVRYQRRLDVLVRVLSRLPDEYRLTIIGGGLPSDDQYRDSLGDLATQLHCADRLTLTNMPQAQIRAVIDRAHLCLSYVPTLECFQDQFVLKTLEYLACHRPVLTTATRYNVRFRESIGAERLLLSDGTVEDTVEKILGAGPHIDNFYSPENLEKLSLLLVPYSSRYLVETRLVPTYRAVLGLS